MTEPSPKPAVPFDGLDPDTGWEKVPGGAPGVELKALSGTLDETAGTGVRTRLIRFRPGTVAPGTFLHDDWEEAYLIDGTSIVGCDASGTGGTGFTAPGYACRPPGTPHGPLTSPAGCAFLEMQYHIGAWHAGSAPQGSPALPPPDTGQDSCR